MKRDSFIFYRSFMEALEALDDKQYARVFRAISKFALDGKEVKLTGVEKVIFQLIKPQLVANQKRYESGCKGGRKSNQNETESEPNDNQNQTENKPNQNQSKTKSKPNENDNENVNDIVSKKESKNNNLNITNKGLESYEDIMTDFGVSEIVKPVLFEFIKHCQLNGRKVINDKLEDIIIELDKYEEDGEKVQALKTAINGGYFGIRGVAV